MSLRPFRSVISTLALLVTATAAVPAAGAQAPASSPAVPPSAQDSLYARAAQLVRHGEGDAGRALVDSVLAATPADDPAYGEGLYWRAALATSAAAAERDYKRVIVEFPASPRAEDALITLAQLELARGDRARAVAHLERLQLEHPSSAHRARAYLWMARAQFDLRRVTEACAALRGAEGAMQPDDVELRTQVEFLSGRCPAPAAATGAATVAAAAPSPPAPVPSPAPAPVERSGAARADIPPTSRAPAAGAREGGDASAGGYAVQVAAYDSRREAEAVVKRLVARGYKARVVGSEKPWRVRVGSYRTRADANAALARMKKAGLDGFVTGGG